MTLNKSYWLNGKVSFLCCPTFIGQLNRNWATSHALCWGSALGHC